MLFNIGYNCPMLKDIEDDDSEDEEND